MGWKDALSALQAIHDGQGRVSKHAVLFRNSENDTPYASALEFEEISYSQKYIAWSAYFLRVSGLQMGTMFRDPPMGSLGDRLSSLRPNRVMSWRDVERVVGAQSEFSPSHACGVDLFAPVMARLLEAGRDRVTGGVGIPIETFLDPIKCRMEIVAQDSLSGQVEEIIPAKRWRRKRGRTWTAILGGHHRGRIDLTLNMRDLRVWTSTVSLPSMPSRLLDAISGTSEWLERLLLPTKETRADSTGFERAVVSLLALGGLPAVPLGHAGPDRSPDLICAVSDERVLIGECTIGPIAPKKVGDISHRAQEALNRLQRPGERLEQVACIFTPSPRASLPQEHLNMAEQSAVVVIWRERLVQLLELARTGELRLRFWQHIEQWGHGQSVPLSRLQRRHFR